MQQGLGFHQVEHLLVSDLVAAVAENHVVQNGWTQKGSRQRAGRHDESVHHDKHFQLGGTQHGPDGGHHFEASEIADYLLRRGFLSAVCFMKAFHGGVQHFALMTDARQVKPSTCTDALVQRNVSEEMHPDAAWRRVGDAHFADADNVTAIVEALVHQHGPSVDGLPVLLFGHGSFVQEIPCSARNLSIEDALDAAQVVVHAHIDDAKLEPVLSAEHVHAAAAPCKVNHLLPGDVARTDADAFALNAMVAAEQQMARMAECRRERLLHQAHLHGKCLQSSERAFRFVQIVNFRLYAVPDSFVRLLDVKLSHSEKVSC